MRPATPTSSNTPWMRERPQGVDDLMRTYYRALGGKTPGRCANEHLLIGDQRRDLRPPTIHRHHLPSHQRLRQVHVGRDHHKVWTDRSSGTDHEEARGRRSNISGIGPTPTGRALRQRHPPRWYQIIEEARQPDCQGSACQARRRCFLARPSQNWQTDHRASQWLRHVLLFHSRRI